MFDWGDMRLFLEVAKAGSAAGAARVVGVNQTTLSRRMTALEHHLGLTLFVRASVGFTLTEEGQALYLAAQQMAEAADKVMLLANAQRRALSGTIRVTAPEAIFAVFLAPIIAEFRQAHPEVRISYDASGAFADVVNGDVDIAFRATEKAIDERLMAQKVGEIGWGLYCSDRYAQMRGRPERLQDLPGHSIVAYEGQVAEREGNFWFMRQVNPAQVDGYSNTVINMANILRAGLGVGLLPCFQGDGEPGLQRCCGPFPQARSLLWMLSAPSQRRVPRVDAFARLAAERFQALRPSLRGECKA